MPLEVDMQESRVHGGVAQRRRVAGPDLVERVSKRIVALQDVRADVSAMLSSATIDGVIGLDLPDNQRRNPVVAVIKAIFRSAGHRRRHPVMSSAGSRRIARQHFDLCPGNHRQNAAFCRERFFTDDVVVAGEKVAVFRS